MFLLGNRPGMGRFRNGNSIRIFYENISMIYFRRSANNKRIEGDWQIEGGRVDGIGEG